ncbi:MAG: SpoIIE family protein phosphatase, partial [Clostridia bacterium]|nr:SpoIIE family protein phosphatase [Clostridia bacterium]
RALLDESLAALCRDCPTARECTAKKRLFEEPCDAFAADAVTEVEDCLRAEDAREILRKSAARLTREALGVAGPEQFSFDYGISATLLRELSSSLEEAYRENVRLCDAVRRRLADVGYAATSAVVSGGRRKTLTVPGLTPLPPSSRLPYVGRQLELACGFPWEALAVTDGDLTAVQSKTLSVTHGSCLSAKEGVCGDVISVFSDEENGYLYALLDDGMGAGPEAATAAQLGSLFLRRLLPAGVSPETALRMLGQFLRLGHNTRGIEVSTTVDLLSVDLMAGRASFLKSGAAPTYVKRGKNIFYLDSKTAPVGILKEIDAKQIEFDLRPGDLIVMVSDGITDGEKECARLLELLDRTDSEDPTRLAEDIVARAAAAEDHDDLSAIVLRIEEAK